MLAIPLLVRCYHNEQWEVIAKIAFASKTLNEAEVNYSTVEKEMFAIVWGIKHFRPYLFGHKFTIVTDHRPLT